MNRRLNTTFKTNRLYKPKLFAEKLTALRLERNLTKADVAIKIKWHRTTYYKLEHNSYQTLPTSFVLLLAEFYNVNPGYLIDDREPVKTRSSKKCVFQKINKLTQESKSRVAEYIDRLYEQEQQRLNAPKNEYL